jgi:uncharacterized protein (TIRG00374 family)
LFNAATVLRAYRWQVLFLKERVSLWRLFLVQNTGIGLNNLSPVRVVSEPTQWVMLTVRYGVKGGPSAATLGMERVLDMVASAVLLGVSLLFVPAKGVLPIYLFAAFLIAAIAVILVVMLARAGNWPLVRRIDALRVFTASVADLLQARSIVAYSLVLSVTYWMCVGFCVWLASLGMPGMSISLVGATFAMVATLYLTTSLPSLPMALGTFEAAFMYVIVLFGVDASIAFSYAVVVHVLLHLPPTAIAMAVVVFMGVRPRTYSTPKGDAAPEGTRLASGKDN